MGIILFFGLALIGWSVLEIYLGAFCHSGWSGLKWVRRQDSPWLFWITVSGQTIVGVMIIVAYLTKL